MFGSKKRKKIEHLKNVLRDHIGDCAYWFCEDNVEQYNICYARAVLTARKIRRLRS